RAPVHEPDARLEGRARAQGDADRQHRRLFDPARLDQGPDYGDRDGHPDVRRRVPRPAPAAERTDGARAIEDGQPAASAGELGRLTMNPALRELIRWLAEEAIA